MSIVTWEFESPPLHYIIFAEIAQLVEHNLAKVGVAGPSPVFRSTLVKKGFKVKIVRILSDFHDYLSEALRIFCFITLLTKLHYASYQAFFCAEGTK